VPFSVLLARWPSPHHLIAWRGSSGFGEYLSYVQGRLVGKAPGLDLPGSCSPAVQTPAVQSGAILEASLFVEVGGSGVVVDCHNFTHRNYFSGLRFVLGFSGVQVLAGRHRRLQPGPVEPLAAISTRSFVEKPRDRGEEVGIDCVAVWSGIEGRMPSQS
jgi:hypothetical protein